MPQPRYGFNFQWMSNRDRQPEPAQPDLDALNFLVQHGFDFVRVPLDYRYWTEGTAYAEMDQHRLENLDDYAMACQERELHCSLALHRAPGWCSNDQHLETHNLWVDTEAQDGFVAIWEALADRYTSIDGAYLEFDLLNEPPVIGQLGCTRDVHAALMRRTVAAIRAIDPDRPIAVDGLDEGNAPMPELADLGVTQSARGYQPMPVSHHQARWWSEHASAPAPVWPGLDWGGRRWDRSALMDWYAPWRELAAQGVAIHVGECGCHDRTPADIALPWLRTLLELYAEWGWGWALGEFRGSFGIIGHQRPGTIWEERDGLVIDRELFALLCDVRV